MLETKVSRFVGALQDRLRVLVQESSFYRCMRVREQIAVHMRDGDARAVPEYRDAWTTFCVGEGIGQPRKVVFTEILDPVIGPVGAQCAYDKTRAAPVAVRL